MDYSITIALGLGFSLIVAGVALAHAVSRRRADAARVPARSSMPFRSRE